MKDLMLIAGPCTIETLEKTLSIAKKLKSLGIEYLRGGAFKPRTEPESFQGLGEKGLKILKEVKEKTGMKIVTEVMGPEEIELVMQYADILQIGSRNMHNYDLLKKIGKKASNKDVLLKRGMSATKKELLGSIRYLKQYGHIGRLYICERGIRTFSNGEYDRFTLDVSLIADLKDSYDIIVDPSHAAGKSSLVEYLAYSGIAAGAKGFMIEVKANEEDIPKCDANQAITIEKFAEILRKCKELHKKLYK
ncbi:MAG: N-acetylneuraminate synthase family protein [Nanoarchaeota archaeon]|nr:N-acetylneuraminate synthase family protein [Nanoarchaeota archaeon]